MHIEAEDFLSVLETGMVLCRHANEVMRVMGIRVGMRVGMVVVVVVVTGSPVCTRCASWL